MSNLFRFLTIIFTIARYRLDTLVNIENAPKRVKLLLLPLRIFPTPKESRGLRLRRAFEELGPIFVKFGQLLSTRPDLIAEDIVKELDHLQDNVTPFDNTEFCKIVEASLGDSIDSLFKTFSRTPLASASVAQVHAATLFSGEEVIIKAVRPGIALTIQKDINLLMFFARLIERYTHDGPRFRPIEVVEDYRNTIFDELDLTREAANASQLRRNFENSPMLYIPKVFWEYTRNNVMVMERIYGIPVSDIDTLKQQNTNFKILAERGVEIFFTQVFDHNFFHADMHPGNVFVSRDTPDIPGYIAVDFAIVGSLTREDQYYLARNLLAMFRRDYKQVAELHVSSGWVPPNTSISGFESAIRAVCEPIFEKPIKEISFGHALITLFRTAQRYNMPVQPQLVLLQKTLLNIEGLGRQLYPELNLWDTAHPFLERWIKKRYHPKTIWKEVKYNSPELIEKLPQVPHLVFEALNDVKEIAAVKTELHKLREDHRKSAHAPDRRRKVIASIALGAAAYFAWPVSSALPGEVVLLTLIAFIALIL
ncbi:putative protein kinase UbiB [Thalassocella blandensis]|nr:putative protein kinase UbiB [Thalassocella blandensis]